VKGNAKVFKGPSSSLLVGLEVGSYNILKVEVLGNDKVAPLLVYGHHPTTSKLPIIPKIIGKP
jgi:hypothetical protein